MRRYHRGGVTTVLPQRYNSVTTLLPRCEPKHTDQWCRHNGFHRIGGKFSEERRTQPECGPRAGRASIVFSVCWVGLETIIEECK